MTQPTPEQLGLKPKLDYLYGYSVKQVLTKKSGGYVIEFENGALVSNEDENAEVPTELEGLAFLGTIFSTDSTRLRFGVQTVGADGSPVIIKEKYVSLPPTNYTITDPRFPDTGAAFPQRATEEVEHAKTIIEQFQEQAAAQMIEEEAGAYDWSADTAAYEEGADAAVQPGDEEG